MGYSCLLFIQKLLHLTYGFHSCYHLAAPVHSFPTPLLLLYLQMVFLLKRLATLDNDPSGFGKGDLCVKVKYFKTPADIIQYKFCRIKFSWMLQKPQNQTKF